MATGKWTANKWTTKKRPAGPTDLFNAKKLKAPLEVYVPKSRQEEISELEREEMEKMARRDSSIIMNKLELKKGLMVSELSRNTDVPKDLIAESMDDIISNIRECVDLTTQLNHTTLPTDESILEKARSMGLKSGVIPKDTQYDAVRFMLSKENIGCGSIIAHEMGLGKTLSGLLLERISYDSYPGVTLIMTPTAVNLNWVNEALDRFDSKIRILIYFGKDRHWISYNRKHRATNGKQESNRDITVQDIEKHDIVIVHYEALAAIWKTRVKIPVKNYLNTLTAEFLASHGGEPGEVQKRLLKEKFPLLDWSKFERSKANSNWINVFIRPNNQSVNMTGPLLGYGYKRIIFDEGHKMRNSKTQCAQMCAAISAKWKHIFTGTPDFNVITNLWSLFRCIRVPRLCTEKSFGTSVNSFKKILGLSEHAQISMQTVIQKIESLREKINSEGYLNWDEINAKVVVDLTDTWMQKVTKNTIAANTRDITEMLDEKIKYADDGWELLNYSIDGVPPCYRKIFRFKLPQSLMEAHECIRQGKRQELLSGTIKNEGTFIFETMSNLQMLVSNPVELKMRVYEKYCNPETVKEILDLGLPKFPELLNYRYNYMKDGEKGVIFTRFIETAKRLYSEFEQIGIKCLLVDSSFDQKIRWDIYTQFNKDPNILFLITTHCTNTGINLTGGNHVLFEIGFWTFNEDYQCLSRVARPGQTKDVRVAYFVAEGTIDENIIKKATTKQSMSSSLTKSDKREILGF